MRRRYNIYGVPIFSENEKKRLRYIIELQPCKICRSRAGHPCKIKSNEGKSMYHVGRLPHGFNSAKAIWGEGL